MLEVYLEMIKNKILASVAIVLTLVPFHSVCAQESNPQADQEAVKQAIIGYVKKEYKLMIGSQTAEEVKLEIGSAYPLREEVQAEIRGRDMITGLPKTVVLSSEDVREALQISPDVPMVVTDARDRGSTKATLLELVQHALSRANAAVV